MVSCEQIVQQAAASRKTDRHLSTFIIAFAIAIVSVFEIDEPSAGVYLLDSEVY